MADLSFQYLGIVAAIFVATGFLFLYLWLRLRRRRVELSRDAVPTREVLEDRAFNQIHLARVAEGRLAAAGVDTAKVEGLIRRAEEARARGDPDTAIALARSAGETLSQLRTAPPTTVPRTLLAPRTSGPGGAPASSFGASGDLNAMPPSGGPAGWDAGPPEGSPPKLPKNKAESRFQLSLLESDVARAEKSNPRDPDLPEARQLLDSGRQAFDRGDYTEALRLGLRGRRRAGGRLESLAPGRAGPATPEPATSSAAPESATTSPELHCATCGAPMREADAFCRACGATRGSARCAQCGEALAGNDRFCGVCGAPVRS